MENKEIASVEVVENEATEVNPTPVEASTDAKPAAEVKEAIKRTVGIYLIECTQKGTKYVGSSKQCEVCWRDYLRYLERNKHSNSVMQAEYNELGKDAFSFTILEECQESELASKKIEHQVRLGLIAPKVVKTAEEKEAEKVAKDAAKAEAKAKKDAEKAEAKALKEKKKAEEKAAKALKDVAAGKAKTEAEPDKEPTETEIRNAKIREAFAANPDTNIGELAQELGCSVSTVFNVKKTIK